MNIDFTLHDLQAMAVLMRLMDTPPITLESQGHLMRAFLYLHERTIESLEGKLLENTHE